MDDLLLGVRYGLIAGMFAWFGGWGLSKVIKLIRYVTR